MEIEQIKEILKQNFAERLNVNLSAIKISDDDGLFDENGCWGFDSVDAIDIALGVEQSFGITVPDDDAVKQHFHSLNTLAAFIKQEVDAKVA
jgi:acyl carrier protein